MRKFFSQNCLGQEISRRATSILLAATLAVLAGCGSGSSVPKDTTSGTTTGTGGTTPAATSTTAATVQLLVSSPQIPSSGATTVDLTATVLSASKQTVSGSAVTFSTGADTTAFISDVSGVSNANGSVTARLNLGTNKTNRTITVTATAGTATATNSVDVTGTAITIAGSNSLSAGASTTLVFSLKDSAGTPVRGVALFLSTRTGNDIAPATGITNNLGQVSAVITANKSGNDVITATVTATEGTETNATKTLAVSSESFALSTPTLDIPLAGATVFVAWADAAGAPQSGKQVTFASSRGTVIGSPATTDAKGIASVTVSSLSSSGPAIITATGPGGAPAATLNVVFVATVASSVTVQAVPSTIQVTTTSASQATNSSTITAVVRDAIGNVVKNAGVNFSVTSDPSGGSLTAASAITDVSGTASVTYIAGIISGPQNGVQITATVTDVNGTPLEPTLANSAALTVSGQSLFVRLGTDKTIEPSAVFYVKKYIAIVTDSGGHPVSNTDVRFVLRPSRYFKGVYGPAEASVTTTITDPVTGTVTTFTTSGIAPRIATTSCANEDYDFSGINDSEDLNRNNKLDSGEDKNGNGALEYNKDLNQNGQLDPSGIASVNASAKTDASGLATATITYPKDYATWVEVILEARTGVAGNDPPALATFVLPILIDDIGSGGEFAHGSTSPYGAGAAPDNVCTNTK